MLIAIDYDGTVVEQDGHRYDDLRTPPRLMHGARVGLLSLKKAGHKLVLWSGRARRALRENDPQLDPLVAAGVKLARRDRDAGLNEARFRQMVEFVGRELPGVFDYIFEGGEQDKPSADLFIDNQAVRIGYGVGGVQWPDVARIYGQFGYGGADASGGPKALARR